MNYKSYNLKELRKKLVEFGVPKGFRAFGNQVTWDLEDVEEGIEPIDDFIEFLQSWNVEGINPAGEWGNYMAWGFEGNVGIGIANVYWN